MPIEKQRVLDRFNPKYGTVSMPKLKLDAMAAKFALLISDDATDEVIDSFLDTMNEAHSFKDIAADEHRKATPPKPNPPKPEPAPADQPNPNPAPEPADDTPAWAKALMQEVQTLKTEKQQTTIKAKAEALFKEKNVPETFYGVATLPAKEEELQAFVEGLSTKYTELQQSITNSSIGNNRPPFGTAQTGNKKQASKEEVDAIMAHLPNT